jgi:hypothetical protein
MDPDVFATLTPLDSAAKRTFNDAAALCRTQPLSYWSDFMYVNPLRVYDADDARDLELSDAGVYQYDSEAFDTSADEATTATRKERYTFWNGHYTFKLSNRDSDVGALWMAGTGRTRSPLPGQGVQFKMVHSDVRGMHAKFALDPMGYITVFTATTAIRHITVDGAPLPKKPYFLNKRSAIIGIGNMSFKFSYTDYSLSDDFGKLRKEFCSKAQFRSGQGISIAELSLTPMPAQETKIIGAWTLAKELGKGASGKVYSATNSSGVRVAIKLVERNKRSEESLRQERDVLVELTREATMKKCKNIIQLVQLIGKIDDHDPELIFQEIGFVLSPAAYSTIDSVVKGKLPFKVRMSYFQDLLFGIKLMHESCYVHCDIKPANVGICQDGAVLLDMGGVQKIRFPATSINPTPGQGGTIGFLAPEQEIRQYNYEVDIWASGIILYALITGSYPMQMSKNPWRAGHERFLDGFHALYESAMQELDGNSGEASAHCDLAKRMLRFEWARCNLGSRISVHEALAHQAWREENARPAKVAKR